MTRGIKKKGMKRRVSIEEIEKSLREMDLLPTDYFLLQNAIGEASVCVWDQRGKVFIVTIEDDDLWRATIEYLMALDAPVYASIADAEKARLNVVRLT